MNRTEGNEGVERARTAPEICNRLRGVYRIPITDGLGAVGVGDEPDNPSEFVRRFPTVPIQERAAELIEDLLEALQFVANATNPDDPESYRSDDREGCLDTVRALSLEAIAKAEGLT